MREISHCPKNFTQSRMETSGTNKQPEAVEEKERQIGA